MERSASTTNIVGLPARPGPGGMRVLWHSTMSRPRSVWRSSVHWSDTRNARHLARGVSGNPRLLFFSSVWSPNPPGTSVLRQAVGSLLGAVESKAR